MLKTVRKRWRLIYAGTAIPFSHISNSIILLRVKIMLMKWREIKDVQDNI